MLARGSSVAALQFELCHNALLLFFELVALLVKLVR